MGVRFFCSGCGRKLNVKAFQAGRRGLCPYCGGGIQIPTESTRPGSRSPKGQSDHAPDPEAVGATAPRIQSAAQTAGSTPWEGESQPAASPSPEEWHGRLDPVEMAIADAADLSQAASVRPPPGPPAETVEMVWYVRPSGGGQYGPAPTQVIEAWIAEGRVSADALVWREGWRDWQEAVLAFPQLGAGDAGPEPGAITAPGTTSPAGAVGAHRRSSRRRSTAWNTAVITVLVLAVIVLVGMFLWVLAGGFPP